MRQVIIRDDDTNAFTPPECLDRLYRPFLDRGMPVNLAVIPAVRGNAATPDGKREEFLFGANGGAKDINPLAKNSALVDYLRGESGYRIVQHGCHHDTFEFDLADEEEITRRLNLGTRFLADAGFLAPKAFVAPHDRLSRAAYRKSVAHFRVISTGWFELNRLPRTWWPKYLVKKACKTPHWRIGETVLLSHPGCLLSRFRPREHILDEIRAAIAHSSVTVLVTHWWEYFPNGQPDDAFISILHQTADLLAAQPDVQVIAFDELL